MLSHPKLQTYRQPEPIPGRRPEPIPVDDFAALTREDGLLIGFQLADGYQAPSWPDQSVPQQLDLDFEVDDLDEAGARVLELGAGQPGFQPGGDLARVFTDPAGHPFCLARNPSA